MTNPAMIDVDQAKMRAMDLAMIMVTRWLHSKPDFIKGIAPVPEWEQACTNANATLVGLITQWLCQDHQDNLETVAEALRCAQVVCWHGQTSNQQWMASRLQEAQQGNVDKRWKDVHDLARQINRHHRADLINEKQLQPPNVEGKHLPSSAISAVWQHMLLKKITPNHLINFPEGMSNDHKLHAIKELIRQYCETALAIPKSQWENGVFSDQSSIKASHVEPVLIAFYQAMVLPHAAQTLQAAQQAPLTSPSSPRP